MQPSRSSLLWSSEIGIPPGPRGRHGFETSSPSQADGGSRSPLMSRAHGSGVGPRLIMHWLMRLLMVYSIHHE